MARRNFIRPDGAAVSLDEADFAAAQAQGYRPETPEEAKRAAAGEQPVQAAVEGALRSATLGLSDVFQGGYAKGRGEDPREIGLRREENPLAAGAGEVAGFFTPGPAAVMKVGAGTARAAATAGAGRAVARAAGGAAEGGIFGLGIAISEDAIGDKKLNGEHVAAGVLGSTLIGAAAAPVLGKVADLGKSALIKAFGGSAIRSSLTDLAEKSVGRSITQPADLGKKNLRGRIDEVSRFGIDEGFTAGAPSMTTASARAAARAKIAWDGINDALDVADTMTNFDPFSPTAKMQAIVDEMRGNPAMAGAREKLQAFIDKMADPAQTPPDFRKAWETMQAMLNEVGEKTATKGTKNLLFRMRGAFQDDVFAQVDKFDPGIGGQLRQATRDYANAASFRDLALKRADERSRGMQFTDYLAGSAAAHGGFLAGGPIGLVAGPAAMFVSRTIRERGGFAAASALEALNRSGALPKIARGFQIMMASKLGQANFGGAFRATLETAAARGAMNLLETHLTLAQTEPDYLASVGLEDEAPGTLSTYADKAHRLGLLSNEVDGAGDDTEGAIERMLAGSAPTSKGRAHPPTRAEYDRVKTQLQALAADNGETRKQLAELAPTTAGLAQINIVAAANKLLELAPKNPTEGLPPAFQRPWSPGAGELRAWFQQVDAVADPRRILDQLRRGSAPPAVVATVKELYPALFQDLRDRMMARLEAWGEPLDRQRRGQFNALLGDLEDPAVTQLLQAAHARSMSPVGATPKPDGRQRLDVDRNLQTQAQRLEGR